MEDTNDMNASEERELDALIARYGGDYNRPPDIVPVEEIWSRIIAAAQQPAARTGWQTGRWRLIAASVAILGAGVVLGRGWDARAGHVGGAASSRDECRHGSGCTERVADRRGADHERRRGIEPPAAQVASAPQRRRPGDIVKSVRSCHNARSTVPTELRQGNEATYQLATMRHFTEVETLLTSYSTSSHDATADAQLASWARDLLSQTRMLLDSPAATDPGRRKLLQDLEVVLVEMSQLSGDAAPVERDLIDGSVRGSDVITRLRSAVPAGGAMHLKELD